MAIKRVERTVEFNTKVESMFMTKKLGKTCNCLTRNLFLKPTRKILHTDSLWFENFSVLTTGEAFCNR